MESTAYATTLLVVPGESKAYYNNENEVEERSLLARGSLSIDLVPVPLENDDNTVDNPSYDNGLAHGINTNDRKHDTSGYDEWLIIRIDDVIEIPLSSVTTVTTIRKGVYTVPCPSELCCPQQQLATGKSSNATQGVTLTFELPIDFYHDDCELFEIILNQRTALVGSDQTKDYNNRIVLVDEPTGQVIGDLDSSAFTVKRDVSLENYHPNNGHSNITSSIIPPPLPPRRSSSPLSSKPSSPLPSRPSSPSPISSASWNNKEPVVIDLQQQDHSITVTPLSHYAARKQNSRIVNAAEFVSRGILYTSEKTTSGMSSVAQSFTDKTKQTTDPIVFKPSTHARIEKIGKYSGKAAKISKKTIGSITRIASELSEKSARKSGVTPNEKHRQNSGNVRRFVNNSLVAFNTILDSAEEGGRTVLNGASESSSKMIAHRYGPEAGNISRTLGTSGTNVALVYIDAKGVSRKALLRSAGKGFLRAQMSDGREVILGNEDQLQNKSESEISSKSKESR